MSGLAQHRPAGLWPRMRQPRATHAARTAAVQIPDRRRQTRRATAGNECALAERIAVTLRRASGKLPSLADMADQLHISTRTLNRQLRREGTCYRQLAKNIQHELACQRLTAGDMGVSQVAYSLGFTEVANFSRAFRARAGCSPSAYALRAQAITPSRQQPAASPASQPRSSVIR